MGGEGGCVVTNRLSAFDLALFDRRKEALNATEIPMHL